MNVLEKIFGGENRLKIMRLFLVGPEIIFTKEDVSKKCKISSVNTLKEIKLLVSAGFLKEKKYKTEKELRGKIKKASVVGWKLNLNFQYLTNFRSILLSSDAVNNEDLLKKLKRVGKIKLVITAGVFINNIESRADLLIVGDDVNKKSLGKIIRVIESKIGRELNYGVFDTEDFKYRITVYDKFVRDVLDFPHNKILDRMID